MNFVTELPKRDPIVEYIVASAVKSEKASVRPASTYRMHAVVLSSPKAAPYILCHLRSLPDDEVPKSDPESIRSSSPAPKKKQKRAPLAELPNGLHALLEAATNLKAPLDSALGRNYERERDYISLFQCPTTSKFPLFGGSAKPTFEVIHS